MPITYRPPTQTYLVCFFFLSYAPRLPKPGETLIGTKFMTSYGGKGANQCVAAAKLGLKPYMICRVSRFFLKNSCYYCYVNRCLTVLSLFLAGK